MTLTLNSTGKKILQKAQALVQEKGYQFLSFQDLADLVSIRKASVHHYFRTKEDLAKAMIQDYRGKIEQWIHEIDASTSDPRERLRAYFKMFEEISHSGKLLCPGGAFLMDWNNFSKPVRNELQAMIGVHREWLIKIFTDAVQNKTARIGAEQVAAHATLVGSSLQGSLQLARTSRDPEAFFKRLFQQIEDLTFKETLS